MLPEFPGCAGPGVRRVLGGPREDGDDAVRAPLLIEHCLDGVSGQVGPPVDDHDGGDVLGRGIAGDGGRRQGGRS
ncbi:hypothetical protein GCM10010977_05170 [Citricoccus zhacaiensis]|uniref:Uncharacterized protein n=1 Tax=Citricoccus zhacaiensis TaxID=489142 RepID=A0ABQ2LPB9_9MICC|nr:hypothetical protein GCM10010977_05170 [Citricoccus zhacaiensis]